VLGAIGRWVAVAAVFAVLTVGLASDALLPWMAQAAISRAA